MKTHTAIDKLKSRHQYYESLHDVYTVMQFAKEFHFSKGAVYLMIDRGDLGCLRRNGCTIRIMKYHVIDWMERCDTDLGRYPDEIAGTSSGPKDDKLGSEAQAQKITTKPLPSYAPSKSTLMNRMTDEDALT